MSSELLSLPFVSESRTGIGLNVYEEIMFRPELKVIERGFRAGTLSFPEVLNNFKIV
jgi:hypothetical protein